MALRTFILLFFTLLSGILMAQDKGIQFFHGTWEEVLAKAKEQKKLVFVDAYTTWCGPCKRMASEVFTQENVGNYYNTNFINFKYDMEKGGGPAFARQYKITAYPTLLYIDGDGKEVHRELGFRAPEALVTAGRSALKQTDRSGDFKAKYDKGDRSPELLRDYAYALLQSGQENLKIANEYLKTQTDLDTEPNLLFLFDFANEADSRIFELLVQKRTALLKLKEAGALAAKVRAACDQTVKKAVTFRNPELLAEAKKKFALFDKAGAKRFAAESDMAYYRGIGDKPRLIKSLEHFVKKFAAKDPAKLNGAAQEILFQLNEPTAFPKAEAWAKKAYSLEAKYEYALTYATVLLRTGQKKEALAVANAAIQLAVAEGKHPAAAEAIVREAQQ
jgi:thiol-disulfide isomerase/thioredoxin